MAPLEFGHPEYWHTRFTKDPDVFDWLLPSNCLDKHISKAIEASTDPSPWIHHIGCGTSALSYHLRKLVKSPHQIHNTDFSVVAVDIGKRREGELFGEENASGQVHACRLEDSASATSPSSEHGTEDSNVAQGSRRSMRWSTINLLSLTDFTSLVSHDKPHPYTIIVDKSTSDSISCVDDVAIILPYPLQPVTTSTVKASRTTGTISQAKVKVKVHALHLLAVHLAYTTAPGGRWFAVSYSGSRFPFLPPYPTSSDEGLLSAELLENGFVHPGRLWRLESHERVEVPAVPAEEGRGKGGQGRGSAVVHRPQVMHNLYVLVRTDLGLEMV
ncbi:hypothetical protein GGX14DRAFT_554300 [Mycena pura]|uniref:Methyltransferase domain-containing protein n=1 Tax=Mycena pura TaxID=153505 RepID=A0AAD6YSA4_9AGAR|nr:hypothetical protein GGX14DRAFT_554300 [Mycena pura]